MKTQQDYHEEWKALGMRFGFGSQVCRHVTNSYKDKYMGVDYSEALIKIRKDAEKRLVEVNRMQKFASLEFIRVISQNIGGIDKASKISGYADAELPALTAYINKVGLLKGIIGCCKYLKPEQLKEWVEYKF